MIDGDGAISYRELCQQTESLKAELSQAGLRHGMGLGVMGRNGRAFVAAMLAGMGCGATVVPISHQLKQAEIRSIVSDIALHAVLDDRSGVTPLDGEPLSIPFAEQELRLVWRDHSSDRPVTTLADAAFIRYTSGTTGSSKGVLLTHRSIDARVTAAQSALNLGPHDAVLWVLPIAFHFLVTILAYLRSGTTIIVCKDLLAQTIIDDANRHQATQLYASPMHFRLLAADRSAKRMDSLNSAISTSSGIPIEVAEAFRQRFNCPVTQAYGIIEVGLPLVDQFSENSDPQTVGYPAAGFELALLNKDDQPVTDGEPGRLAVRGPGLFDGYLKPWQTAQQVMSNGWFMTGDLAVRRTDGKVVICGREKTMINVAGNKAFPEEIEAVLNRHEAIVESHVFGQPHPLMGEIVCAEVVVVKGALLDVEAVLRFCRSQLSTYKVPQRLIPVSHIKQTSSGKVKR